ncbi:MAG: hypothetical protein K0U93_17150 [Gammaproteobacteria bacterium]|nr:hypothetical protein [Gammaproteobacteria bacterium]
MPSSVLPSQNEVINRCVPIYAWILFDPVVSPSATRTTLVGAGLREARLWGFVNAASEHGVAS